MESMVCIYYLSEYWGFMGELVKGAYFIVETGSFLFSLFSVSLVWYLDRRNGHWVDGNTCRRSTPSDASTSLCTDRI